MHYNHCLSQPVHLSAHSLAVSENALDSGSTLYILVDFRIYMHVNNVLSLAYVLVFSIDFAEHQSGQSWSVSVNTHNAITTWYI